MNTKIKTVGGKNIKPDIFYSGDGTVSDTDGSNVVAKVCNGNYYILVNYNNEPCRPKDKAYLHASTRRGRLSGFDAFSWKKITMKAFANYVEFLKTNKKEYLNNMRKE